MGVLDQVCQYTSHVTSRTDSSLYSGPIGIFALLLFMISWPKKTQLPRFRKRSIRRLDVIGCFLLIAASVLCVFAFQQTGLDPNAWSAAIFLGPISCGVFAWALLFGWEFLIAPKYWKDSVDVLIPFRLLKRRVFIAGAVSTMLTGFTYFVTVYNMPMRFQIVNLKSPLGAGVAVLPLVGSAGVGVITAGILNKKKDNICLSLVLGSSLTIIGTGLLGTLNSALAIEPKTFGFQVFVGFGFGMTTAAATIMTNHEVEKRDAGKFTTHVIARDISLTGVAVANGIVAQFRMLGGSIGVAASSAIRGSVEQRELGGLVSPDRIALVGSSAADAPIRQAYANAFNESMMVCTIVAAVCVVISLFTFRRNRLSIEERWRANALQEQQQNAAENSQRSDSIKELKMPEKSLAGSSSIDSLAERSLSADSYPADHTSSIEKDTTLMV
jgi:hypothetical protein